MQSGIARYSSTSKTFSTSQGVRNAWPKAWTPVIIFFFSDFNCKRCIVRSVVVWMAVLLGELIPKFDLVMGELRLLQFINKSTEWFSLLRRYWRNSYWSIDIHSAAAFLHENAAAWKTLRQTCQGPRWNVDVESQRHWTTSQYDFALRIDTNIEEQRTTTDLDEETQKGAEGSAQRVHHRPHSHYIWARSHLHFDLLQHTWHQRSERVLVPLH